ncbi:hypothetical protein [Achromobacter aegrifaciens]
MFAVVPLIGLAAAAKAEAPAAKPYLLSFRSGIVRPMKAATLAAAEGEALDLCASLMQPANVVDRETYRVLSCVTLRSGVDRLEFAVERRGHE